jgi:phosphoribosylformylglycinamidine synthase PurS subunit
MPAFRVAVIVVNKPSARDPEGETIAHVLSSLGYTAVKGVRAGRVFILDVEAGSQSEAVSIAESVAREARLYNPTVHEILVVGLA